MQVELWITRNDERDEDGCYAVHKVDFGPLRSYLGEPEWDRIIEILIANGWGAVTEIVLRIDHKQVRKWKPAPAYIVYEASSMGIWNEVS